MRPVFFAARSASRPGDLVAGNEEERHRSQTFLVINNISVLLEKGIPQKYHKILVRFDRTDITFERSSVMAVLFDINVF
ncbi:hypothetical protein AA313_de0207558 [Arthrobotrys entomopaga]|nr:hypothetical protein AA313_de0207558 [Arthrobotrys entomopaga]